MRYLTIALSVALLLVVTGCARKSKFLSYSGPEVTRIAIFKSERRMYLYHNDEVLEDYRVGLGFEPRGHKQAKGDGRTPEGRYTINRRNPDSAFYLSLGLDYPNEEDIARAREAGEDPGGDIFIHGAQTRSSWFQRVFKSSKTVDWTAGCIAVKDAEIEHIYAMVQIGTVIDIYP